MIETTDERLDSLLRHYCGRTAQASFTVREARRTPFKKIALAAAALVLTPAAPGTACGGALCYLGRKAGSAMRQRGEHCAENRRKKRRRMDAVYRVRRQGEGCV